MQRQLNRWTGGKRRFDFPPQLKAQLQMDGLRIFPGELDPQVGSEMVLFIVDTTPLVYKLRQLEPFQFMVKTGAVRTSYGPIMFMLSWIPDPKTRQPLLLLDSTINPLDPAQVAWWRQLASQAYWHVFLVDAHSEQVGFYEFENNFRLDKRLDLVLHACQGLVSTDFDAAIQEYLQDYSLPDLYAMK